MSAWAAGAGKKEANGHDRKQCPLGNGQLTISQLILLHSGASGPFSTDQWTARSPQVGGPGPNALKLTTGTRLRQSHPLYSLQGRLKLCSVRGGGGVISPRGRGLCKNKAATQVDPLLFVHQCRRKDGCRCQSAATAASALWERGGCGVSICTPSSTRFLAPSIYLMSNLG